MQGENRLDVIVIGAGPSGIAAGRQLQDKKISYIILQGRDRIGGRIHTRVLDGGPVDCGACWMHDFHGNHQNPLHPLVKQFEIEELILERNDLSYFHDVVENRQLTQQQVQQALKLNKQFQYHISNAMEGACEDMSIEQAGKDYFQKIKDYPPVILRCFYALVNGTQNYESASIQELSAVAFTKSSLENLDQGNFLPKQCYGNFIKKASNNLKIQLNKKVIKIDYEHENVKVICADGTIYQCKKVMASLPLGVLKANSVEFHPPLPRHHQKVIEILGYGRMDKILMSFEQNFWGDYQWIGLCHKKRSNFTHIFNFSTPNRNILCIFLTDDFVTETQDKSDEQLIEEVMQLFYEVFSKDKVKLREAIRTNWQKDEFSLGSYSFSKVGTGQIDVQHLRTPIEDKVWLIGEHVTELEKGTVHGAWSSGMKTAKNVIQQLQ